MIEAIANLLVQANASHATLTIRTDGDNNVSIVMNTYMPPPSGKAKEDPSTLALRHALSQALVSQGNAGEIDVHFSESLTQYAYAYQAGSDALNTTSKVISQIEQATKQQAPPAKSSAPTKTNQQATPKKESHSTPETVSQEKLATKPISPLSAFNDDFDDEDSL